MAGLMESSSSVESLLCLLEETFFPLELRPLDQQSRKSGEQEAKVLLVSFWSSL